MDAPSSYGRTAKGGGGPSRADGIKVPSWKSELLTGKPEGPMKLYPKVDGAVKSRFHTGVGVLMMVYVYFT